jgi:hypothetical protein
VLRKPIATLVVPLAAACSGGSVIASGAQGPTVDQAVPLEGVPDRQADPAVVAIEVGGVGVCAGALLASDVVLTARRCVDEDMSAGSDAGARMAGLRPASSLRVLVGDDLATAVERARGYEILEAAGDADVAVVVLDATLDDRVPLTVRPTGAAKGDHLRTVGYGRSVKLVRDHVLVGQMAEAEFLLQEAPCRTGPGGPAIDEATGEIVGILSRNEPGCEPAAASVYTRLDAQASLIEGALAFAQTARTSGAAREKKGPVDMGATCERGADCAAGTCVTYGWSQYCSRPCGPHDKCPARYRCMQSMTGPRVCVEA